MADSTLTVVHSEFLLDKSNNDLRQAVLTFVPSDSYPTGGEPGDLLTELTGCTTIDHVDISVNSAAARTTTVDLQWDATAKKIMAFWTAAAAKGAFAEVDAATDLLTAIASATILVTGRP